MTAEELDSLVRRRAFSCLEELTLCHGDTLPRDTLAQGFELRGQRVPLVGPSGIFKPAILPKSVGIPLSITTAPVVEGKAPPYEDSIEAGGLIRYRYRGTDPTHGDNVGLRKAMQRQVPLVYFFGLVPGKYSAAWPAYVVGDEPAKLTFSVAVDDVRTIRSQVEAVAEDETKGRRLYVTAATKQRLHQAGFRERVLAAYRECCAVCRLKHRELLDAAHILPDRDPRGAPWVSNGLALCKIHHAAFDQDILGIHPDLIIKIRRDVLDETDGPMLRHGLQELNDRPLLVVPRADRLRPNREFLAERYEHFRKAG